MTSADASDRVSAPVDGTEERRLRADARRNRERILVAAQSVLAEQGLAAPIDEIAQRAGVGVGTVYRHFPTQEALYEAIVLARLDRLVADALDLVATEDPGEAFFGFLSAMAEQGAQNMALGDALARAGYDIKAASVHAKERLAGALAGLLSRAQADGSVRPDVIAEDVLALLAASCVAANRRSADPAAARRTLAIVCDGLRPAPAG